MKIMNSSSIPASINVYGYIFCNGKIESIKVGLIRAFALDEKLIVIKNGVISVNSPILEIEIKGKESDRWSINAAIEGEDSTVLSKVNELALQLSWEGIESVYEVYNDEFECIGNIDSKANTP